MKHWGLVVVAWLLLAQAHPLVGVALAAVVWLFVGALIVLVFRGLRAVIGRPTSDTAGAALDPVRTPPSAQVTQPVELSAKVKLVVKPSSKIVGYNRTKGMRRVPGRSNARSTARQGGLHLGRNRGRRTRGRQKEASVPTRDRLA